MFLELPPKIGRKYSDIKMESQRKVFAFKLNELEFETIRNLFIHYDWDFDNALLSENKTFEAAGAYTSFSRVASQEALPCPSSNTAAAAAAAAAAADDDERQNSVSVLNNDSVNGNQATNSESNDNGDVHRDNDDSNGGDDDDDDGSDGESDDSADFDGCRDVFAIHV